MPDKVQSRKKQIKQRKIEDEKRWFKSKFGETEPEFKPLKRENEIAYQLNNKTTVFAPPGTDINLLRKKYGI